MSTLRLLSFSSLLTRATCFLLVIITTVFSQRTDHPMLIENCNWSETNWMQTNKEFKFTLRSPTIWNHNLAPNLVCRTRFYTNDFSYNLKMRVVQFNLKGSDDCSPNSEMLIIQFSKSSGYKNITWCGGMYSEEMVLPSSAVDVIYKTGAFGEGPGLEIDFSTVPFSECEPIHLTATSQPKLLYSPNYPGQYGKGLRCEFSINTSIGNYISIQSKFIQIENHTTCGYDALIINKKKYCGDDPIDILVDYHYIDIQFMTDVEKEFSGFVLKYQSLPVHIVKCAESANNFTLNVSSQQTAVLMENNMTSIPARSNSNSWCHVSLEGVSDNDVLDVVFPSELHNLSSYKIVLSKETVITEKWPGIMNFIHSPSSNILFSASLLEDKFSFRVQSVSSDILPRKITSRYSLIWVPRKLIRSSSTVREMLIKPYIASREKIEVAIFDKYMLNEAISMPPQRYPVADHIAVYNGEDTSYFELTRKCDGSAHMATSIYSISSESITIEVKRNRSSTGFYIYSGISYGNYLPEPLEISGQIIFKSTNTLNKKNLYCRWKLSWPTQSVGSELQTIKFKAENNFSPDIPANNFTVSEGKAALMRFTLMTRTESWLYSQTPLDVTVSIFDVENNPQPVYFKFESYIVERQPYVSTAQCLPYFLLATDTIQSAATPNYPDFYRSLPCETIVTGQKSIVTEQKSNVVIEFPDMSDFSCLENQEFQILTRYYGDWLLVDKFCNEDYFRREYASSEVMVRFISGSQYLMQQGFQFSYYTVVDCSNVNLQATTNTQRLASPNYPNKYPKLKDCRWRISATSVSSIIILDLVDFNLENEYNFQCADYVEIYDGYFPGPSTSFRRVRHMCGQVSHMPFRSTSSDITIIFHSNAQNEYTGFSFEYFSETTVPDTGSDGRGAKVGAVIGIVAGCVCFILVAMGAAFCIVKRRKVNANNQNVRRRPDNGEPAVRSDSLIVIVAPATINQSSAPPPYWELTEYPNTAGPPSYSSVIEDQRYASSDLNSRSHVLEHPPPYSFEMPGRAVEQVPSVELSSLQRRISDDNLHNGTHISAAGEDTNPRASFMDGNTGIDHMSFDNTHSDVMVDDNPTIANALPVISHVAINPVSQNQSLDSPPAYESQSFIQNSTDQQQIQRLGQRNKKNSRLGSL